MNQLQDILDQDMDPVETQEWTESLRAVIGVDGPERAHYLLERMVDEARRSGSNPPFQWCAAIASRATWAAISPASHRRRPCTTSASITSGVRRARITPVI